MNLAKAIVPGCKSLLSGTSASVKGLELMQVTKDNKDRNFFAVNVNELAPSEPAESSQLSKQQIASGRGFRTDSRHRASPEASPKGFERNEHTNENERTTKPSPALEKHEKGDIPISLPSRKAKLWDQEDRGYEHAEKKNLILSMRGISLK